MTLQPLFKNNDRSPGHFIFSQFPSKVASKPDISPSNFWSADRLKRRTAFLLKKICVALFANWSASSLANCEMNVPLSDEHIPSLTSFRAATNILSVSDWHITLVSWNLCVMACWKTLDLNMKRPESKQLGTGRSWRNLPTIIICFPANGNLSWRSSTDKWWCKAFTSSIILALDMLASSQTLN